jgi:hypothetical protein
LISIKIVYFLYFFKGSYVYTMFLWYFFSQLQRLTALTAFFVRFFFLSTKLLQTIFLANTFRAQNTAGRNKLNWIWIIFNDPYSHLVTGSLDETKIRRRIWSQWISLMTVVWTKKYCLFFDDEFNFGRNFQNILKCQNIVDS